jgi:hypothetical protein
MGTATAMPFGIDSVPAHRCADAAAVAVANACSNVVMLEKGRWTHSDNLQPMLCLMKPPQIQVSP